MRSPRSRRRTPASDSRSAAAPYVRLAGHRALELTLQAPFARPGCATVTITETQDWVVANHLLYTITFSGTSPEFATIASTFRVQ